MLTFPKVAFGNRPLPGAYFQHLEAERYKVFLNETCVFLVHMVQRFFLVIDLILQQK